MDLIEGIKTQLLGIAVFTDRSGLWEMDLIEGIKTFIHFAASMIIIKSYEKWTW